MRTAKYTLLLTCLAVLSLTTIQCAKKDQKRDIPSAMSTINKYKAVRILTNAVNPPFESGSGTSVQGLDVDIAAEVVKDLPYQDIKWVKMQFSRLIELLVNGEAELVISAFPVETPITAEQKAEVAFSEPYFTSFDTIARRKDKPEIKDLASLAGKKVGVQGGSTGEEFVKKNVPTATLQAFSTIDDGLGALNRTEIDAMVGDGSVMTYSIYNSFQNLITVDTRLQETHMAIAVRKTEPELLKAANAALERMKAGALEESRKKWFGDVVEKMAESRKQLDDTEKLKDSPKAIVIEMVKQPSAAFNMERLDGYQAELVGPTGSFKSEPILTNGNRGTIRFPVAVPPGKYELRMSIFKFNKEIPLPRKAAKAITFDMSIGSSISIVEREKD